MGFQPTRKRYHLKFADPEMQGLEVVAFSGSTGDILKLSGVTTDSESSAILDSLQIFAKSLVSWNIEDSNGLPLSSDLEGLKTLDLGLVLLIVKAWSEAIADVPGPLGTPSASGKLSLEASLPMEASSPNLPS